MLHAVLRTLVLAPLGAWPPEVEAALKLAAENRAELEGVLAHYAAQADEQKLDAACFLVSNMPGQGFIEYELRDARGTPVEFDPLAQPDYASALKALGALEEQHGSLDFVKKPLLEDLRVMTAEALMRDIESAFAAWREHPWARDVTYDTFREYVLPYRGSNEPLEDWRGPCTALLAEAFHELTPAASVAERAKALERLASRRVGFSELYYLHPTDQGFAEMSRAKLGRCEDITNMTTYVLRAAAIVSAADYTPWWGHRDNNHAWPVVLDGAGRGNSPDGRGAAKVYRKTFSKQRGNLAFQLAAGESAPPWLDRESYIDVTDQYGATIDVRLHLDGTPTQRFAYLCVFNGGEWKPIHWARVQDGNATFTSMGRGLVYLPAYWIDGQVRGAAAPIYLNAEGRLEPLAASAADVGDARLGADGPGATKLDAEGQAMSRLTPGATYELFVWRQGWQSLGRRTADAGPLEWHELPLGGLYWLVRDGSRKPERVFALRNGEQVWM